MADIVSILNNIRRKASYDYQRTVPVATRDNLEHIQEIVMGSNSLQNSYIHAIVNRFAGERYTSRKFENPYKKFIKATYRYGDAIEEIYVNMCNAHDYNPNVAEKELYKREIPDIATAFHPVNSKLFYKQTIQYEDLAASFLSDSGMRGLVAKIVDGMYSSNERDMFYQTKAVANAYKEHYVPVNVSAPNPENANAIVTAIRTMSNMLEFPSSVYNQYGVDNATPKARQVLIIRADVEAVLDVNSLAEAFNLSFRDYTQGTRVTIDTFGEGMENVLAILVDDEFFQIYNQLTRFTENYNGQGDYWQYFLHQRTRYSYSPFSNAICFTTSPLTPPTKAETVPYNSAGIELTAGEVQLFACKITPATAPQNARWSVTGNKSSDTLITATGHLFISPDEPTGTLTVTCTSIEKPDISGSCTVKVTGKTA